jgi:hypothetical protein
VLIATIVTIAKTKLYEIGWWPDARRIGQNTGLARHFSRFFEVLSPLSAPEPHGMLPTDFIKLRLNSAPFQAQTAVNRHISVSLSTILPRSGFYFH